MDDKERIAIARDFSLRLTVGAHAGGKLEVRRLVLSRNARKDWDSHRFTLTTHFQNRKDMSLPPGAFAQILQRSGRRYVYTTTQGRLRIRTLERWTREPIKVFRAVSRSDLAELLEEDLLEALENATHDRRAIRCSVRPPWFDVEEALEEWFQDDRFTDITEGKGEALTEDELVEFLIWYADQIPEVVENLAGGVPVPEEIYEMVTRRDDSESLLEGFNLVRSSRRS